MNTIVPRTCTVIPLGDEKRNQARDSQPLAEFRDAPAYVLLGDPGSGKTTAFETEKEAPGDGACMISARDYIALDVEMHPEWRNKTLFIDGLDEVRVGATDARTPFDSIRNRLESLRRPRFRLSCREADWLGENDWQRLKDVSPDGDLTVLRLDPLTESDNVRILEDKGVEDTGAFLENARERRIDGLLANPQTLEMLAAVAASGKEWPDSRLQTFEQACSYLVREHNIEHKVASQPANTHKLLNAAGRLCAVQLISGIEGYTQGQADPDTDFPSLEEIQFENPQLLQSVLSIKLFAAESASFNRFAPIHRHVAEFLGARYLARLIEDGLPARRVLSLITGEDGIVVTGLRGLSAWLAAHCKSARSELIIRDPVGVGLYGDIRGFSFDEKRALLNALHNEVSRLGSIQLAAAFGPLATPDMEPALRDILSNSSRETEHQAFVVFTLSFLREGPPMRGLSGLLFEIVRDDTWWPRVNMSALNAFIHLEDDKNKTCELKTLLREIQNGSISDPDYELQGTLLTHLYPCDVTPTQVWDYLTETQGTDLVGMYWWFWEHGLLEGSSDQQIAELLDALQHRLPDLRSALEGRLHLERLPSRLLARGLNAYGDELETERLYDWLNVGFSEIHGVRSGDKNAIREIGSWLEERPEVLKRMFVEGLKRCPESEEFRYHALKVQDRLYGAKLPPDFGRWCLTMAVATVDMKPRVAEHLLELAFQSLDNRSVNEGLSFDLIVEHAEENHVLRARLDRLRAPQSIPSGFRVEDSGGGRSRYTDRRRRLEVLWLEELRSNEVELRENRATHDLLYHIAGIYFADSINLRIAGGTGDIENDLGSDQSLIDAVRVGIRGVIERKDVPGVEEILALKKKGQVYHIGWPFLAALAEIEKSTPDALCRLDDEQMRKALAFHFCSASAHEPDWYRRIREARPDVVAEMLVRCGISELRSGSGPVSGLFALAHDKDHAQVARLASLPLLRAFPTRCKNIQIEALDHLFWAAIRHADRTLLTELIERKLATKSMNDAQRARWLGATVVLTPEENTDPLIDFVQGKERRVRYLVGFFAGVFPRTGFSLADVKLGIPVLEVLVRLIGSYFRPYELQYEREDEWNASVNTDSELVHAFIQRLAASRGKDAGDALERLLGDPTLSAWHDVLSRARDFQRVIQRDASYNHPEIQDVCQTLDNRSPANAADLAALLTDHLHEIARNIHDGNTSDWREYWENPSDEKTRKPQHEELCRDALLSDLKYKLAPLPIYALPEGRYVNDSRSDIRVCSKGFNVPVEIKKNNHPDLWTAVKTQLIAKYARDPGAAGHGIYLVFWFGRAFTRVSPSGSRLETPHELQEQLKATLSEEETHRISVRVINVSGEDADWREN